MRGFANWLRETVSIVIFAGAFAIVLRMLDNLTRSAPGALELPGLRWLTETAVASVYAALIVLVVMQIVRGMLKLAVHLTSTGQSRYTSGGRAL